MIRNLRDGLTALNALDSMDRLGCGKFAARVEFSGFGCKGFANRDRGAFEWWRCGAIGRSRISVLVLGIARFTGIDSATYTYFLLDYVRQMDGRTTKKTSGFGLSGAKDNRDPASKAGGYAGIGGAGSGR